MIRSSYKYLRIFNIGIISLLTIMFSCNKPVIKRDFFKEMPLHYKYNDSITKMGNKRIVLENGLSEKDEIINNKHYYRLFERHEDVLGGLAGYIRKESNIIYLIPSYCKENIKEQVFINFNSRVGDTTLIATECGEKINAKLVLINISQVNSNDSIYSYKTFISGACDDCTHLIFFQVSIKNGFTKLTFQNMKGFYDLYLNAKEVIVKR